MKWKAFEMDGKSNSVAAGGAKSIASNGRVRQQLKSFGMSEIGIRQLSASQPVTNKNDQAIVARIVSQALS